jgi:anti-anti-sigma regulatory factor
VDCDVSQVRRADLATVDALAHACVNARRLGTRLRVVNASPALEAVIALAGLADVLLGPGRQPKEGEQAVGVEEGVEADDPSV